MSDCHPGLQWDLVSIENPAFGFVLHTVPGWLYGKYKKKKKNPTPQFALFLRLMTLDRQKGENCLTAMLEITEGDRQGFSVAKELVLKKSGAGF